jgi:hypothetical protein
VITVLQILFCSISLFDRSPPSACSIIAQVAEDTGMYIGDAKFWNTSIKTWFELISTETATTSRKYASVFRGSTAAAASMKEYLQKPETPLPWKTAASFGPVVNVPNDMIQNLPRVLNCPRFLDGIDAVPDSDLAFLLQYVVDRRTTVPLTVSHLPSLFKMCVKACNVTTDESVVKRCLVALGLCLIAIPIPAAGNVEVLATEDAREIVVSADDLWKLILEKRGHAYFWSHLSQAAGVIFSRVLLAQASSVPVIADCLNQVSVYFSCNGVQGLV